MFTTSFYLNYIKKMSTLDLTRSFFRFIRIAMPSTVACAKDLTHFHASNPLPSFKFIYKTYRASVPVHRYQSTVLQVKAGTEPDVVVSITSIIAGTIGCWKKVSTVVIIASSMSTLGTC